MSAVEARELEAVFDAVVDLSASDAERHLDETCAGKPELRAAVERLLAHDRALPATFLLPHELRESARVGRYQVLRRLGEGGMGEVYAAYDESLDRRVALKVLRTPHAPVALEAQALAKLAHPHVVAVHEVGTHEGRPFIAMELVEGVTLREWLEGAGGTPDAPTRGPRAFTGGSGASGGSSAASGSSAAGGSDAAGGSGAPGTEEILRMFVQCGRGLAAAHEAGIVHRDFKPENVIVGRDGRARVLDFGIAVARDSATKDLAGTPHYMSPEQLAAASGGPRRQEDSLREPLGVLTAASDQFSFCVALYRALYRSSPFAGDDFESLKKSVLAGALKRPPREDWVAPILFRGLARHPAARWGSMPELLAAIEAKLPRDPELDRSATSAARRRLILFMAAAAGVVVVFIQLRGGFEAMTMRATVGVSAFVFAAAAANVFARRRQLFANRFGRQVAAVVLMGTATLLIHRLVALRFDQPLAPVLTVDMLMLAFELVLAGFLVQRAFFVGATALFAGTAAALLVPERAMLTLATAMVITIAGVAQAWRRE